MDKYTLAVQIIQIILSAILAYLSHKKLGSLQHASDRNLHTYKWSYDKMGNVEEELIRFVADA
jgi:hypothetical protein